MKISNPHSINWVSESRMKPVEPHFRNHAITLSGFDTRREALNEHV